MEKMTIHIVLFKGIEIRTPPRCKPFREEQDARAYCEASASTLGLVIKSTLGGYEERGIDDYRCEDSEGNTYYFVLTKHEI